MHWLAGCVPLRSRDTTLTRWVLSFIFFFKQKTAYEMRISDWSSDVCSSDLYEHRPQVNSELLALDKVVLLPHMGSATIECRRDMGERVIVNIRSFADGHTPPDRVIDTMF